MAGNGASLGFVSQELETELGELPVDGSLPEWLGGSADQDRPGEVGGRKQTMNHWFDGHAMLHRFGIADGSVAYATAFSSPGVPRGEGQGEIGYGEFATDPCRSLFRRFQRCSPRSCPRTPTST